MRSCPICEVTWDGEESTCQDPEAHQDGWKWKITPRTLPEGFSAEWSER